jgi:hypothetical protein
MVTWYILWPFCILYGYLVYFMAIWFILWLFGLFYGYLVYFIIIWYIFHHFCLLYQEKSGNPGKKLSCRFNELWFDFRENQTFQMSKSAIKLPFSSSLFFRWDENDFQIIGFRQLWTKPSIVSNEPFFWVIFFPTKRKKTFPGRMPAQWKPGPSFCEKTFLPVF